MGQDSKIEWTHHTFNPWWGCQRVSSGCEHCYAETFAKRVGLAWGPKAERRFFGTKHWAEPLKWNREAEKAGERRRVFCASMADVFEDRPELNEPRVRLFDLIDETPWLDWLLLTKRPEQVRHKVPTRWWPRFPKNVWMGTTVENQKAAEDRVWHMLDWPAAVRFLSCEPLLGHVDLREVAPGFLRPPTRPHDPIILLNALTGHVAGPDEMHPNPVNWVIVGGESGHGARPFELSWARDIVRHCRAAGVPVLVKQLGLAASDPENGLAGAGLKVHPDAAGLVSLRLKDRKGGDWSEWPADLRVREYPMVTA